jgi:hypothetical protein
MDRHKVRQMHNKTDR